MKRGKSRLPSVHYDTSTLSDLVEIIQANSGGSGIEIEISDEDGIRTFTSISDVSEDLLLPDRVTEFRLTVHTDEGNARVSADTFRDSHTLTLDGDREWYSTKKSEINSYLRSNEYSKFRSKFGFNYRLMLGGMGFSYLMGSQFQYILPYFGVPIFYQYPPINYLNLFAGIAVIATSLALHKISPYVLLFTNKSKEYSSAKRYIWKAIAFLAMISTIAAGAVAVMNYFS